MVLAGAGGYDTREVIHAVAEMRRRRRPGHPVGDAVLQQADAGRPVPALQGDRRAARKLPIIVYNVPGRTGCNVDPATLVRLAAIPNIVGVKEASGNMTQMAEICRAVPPDFLVLSGDDALTLPLMAIGGRGIISVASNEVPAEMVQMVEAAERGDFAAARHWHEKLLPLMQVNFIESNPGPGEVRDGGDGAVRRGVPAADGAAAPGVAGKDPRGAQGVRPADRRRNRARERPAGTHRRAVRRRARTRTTRRSPRGLLRAAARDSAPDASAPPSPMRRPPSGWRVNAWVKQGILLGFRFGDIVDVSADHGRWPFYDKDTMPLKKPGVDAGVRIVPGGSTIREGAFVARSVVCMPPMYVNIGAYVDEGTLVDSHALVGSCAQIGKRVHLSAGAQIGGVIEPVGALPVIIEDDVLVGGNTGVYEGAVIKRRAVIAAGVVLTGSTPVYDLPRGEIIRPEAGAAAGRARRRRRRARRARGDRRQGPASGACRWRRP